MQVVVLVLLALGGCALALAGVYLGFRLAKAQVEQERRLAEKRLEDKEAACRQRLDEKDAACRQFTERALETLRVQFAHLAEERLKASSEGLSNLNRQRLAELMAPFQKELGDFRHAFEENRKQQIVNKASFDQAIKDLGARALQIGADAENLAKALKNESKTQGDWGEMVLANILSVAALEAAREDAERYRTCPCTGTLT